MHGYKGLIVALIMAASTQAARASEWALYANARYAFLIDIPPGFSTVVESDNGDGGVSKSNDGNAELRVWGSYLADGSFATEIAWRIKQDQNDGWKISYDKGGRKAASWSGSKGDRILYDRSVVGCDGAAIYFSIEYDRADLSIYDPVIKRLVKSLRGSC